MTTRFRWAAHVLASLAFILSVCLSSILVAVFSTPVAASDDTMVFRTEPPDPQFVIVTGNAWNIYAEGVIDADAPKRAEQLIEQLHIPPNSFVYLNSPGGNLYAGMELGRVFRKSGFSTSVGKQSGPRSPSAGVCLSACTLTFLGGRFRFLPAESTYGVHRFFLTGSVAGSVAPADALAAGQIFSADILQYIREMGADPELLNEMTRAGSDEINVLPKSRLKELSVVNDGEGKTTWTVESKGNPVSMLYLKGERDTWLGLNKFLLYCDPSGKKVLVAIFDPQGRGDEVMAMHANSIMVDDQVIHLSDKMMIGPTMSNDLVVTYVILNDGIVERLRSASSVGISFQYSYEAPAFLGFQAMDFTGGRDQFVGLLSSCKSSAPTATLPRQ
jgi:hypothetical protein